MRFPFEIIINSMIISLWLYTRLVKLQNSSAMLSQADLNFLTAYSSKRAVSVSVLCVIHLKAYRHNTHYEGM